jgi:hypothetical protein
MRILSRVLTLTLAVVTVAGVAVAAPGKTATRPAGKMAQMARHTTGHRMKRTSRRSRRARARRMAAKKGRATRATSMKK